MRYFILFLVTFLVSSMNAQACSHHAKPWTSEKGFAQPESALLDPKTDVIYVSNVAGEAKVKDGKGWISKLNHKGEALAEQWVSGLHAPKGMAVDGDTLWVSDIDAMVKINTVEGKIEKRIEIPGSKFLNDVTVNKGVVYVSDMEASRILKIEGDKVEVLVEGPEWESPNGLYVDGKTLYVAAWGYTPDVSQSPAVKGNFYSINLDTKAKTVHSRKPLGNLDGLWKSGHNGTFYVSDWVSGEVFAVSRKGWEGHVKGFRAQLNSKKIQGLADLSLANALLLVPSMVESKVYGINPGIY
jgi:sugar lactone lactonase YvrE